MTPERRARIALSLVAEPGDARLTSWLMEVDASTALARLREGRGPEGSPPAAWLERLPSLASTLDDTVARGRAAGLRWVCPDHREWPTALDDLDHVEALHGTTGRPLGLWVRGRVELARLTEVSIAVVGARDCTTYGAEVAAELSADASADGLTVVSGAAFGIDAAAHRGALGTGTPTVAVLAGGADVDYPRAHSALLSRIAQDGAVVSEQPPGRSAYKAQFLSRNRIIAGLTRGTVVVEAAVRSGSLNTLRWADRLGRTTMAVPGPVLSQASSGTHEAIRSGTAVLVTAWRDVADDVLGPVRVPAGGAGAARALDSLPSGARRVLDVLDARRPVGTADVAAAARLDSRSVQEHLSLLVERGLAHAVPTGWLLARVPGT